ncbi:MAG TPA: late competence development ComFB family protein [Coleofasciculaceae cyanobacterium]
MSTTIVNLTLLKLSEELENILAIYSEHTYQRTLNNPDLRTKLVAYVLNRMPNRYITVEEEELSLISSQSILFSTHESLKMEKLIHQGVYDLSEKKDSYDFCQDYRQLDLSYSSSRLFN